jgi:hypothetical protein
VISLDQLRMKSQNSQITYLKSKNILPLFYHFLQDPVAEIREVNKNNKRRNSKKEYFKQNKYLSLINNIFVLFCFKNQDLNSSHSKFWTPS